MITSNIVNATHSPDYAWMGYCCGQGDCREAVVSIVEFKSTTIVVLVNGLLMELSNSVVRESQDGHTYWCAMRVDEQFSKDNTRCVFYAIGG